MAWEITSGPIELPKAGDNTQYRFRLTRGDESHELVVSVSRTEEDLKASLDPGAEQDEVAQAVGSQGYTAVEQHLDKDELPTRITVANGQIVVE